MKQPMVLAQQKSARTFAAFFLPGTPLSLFLQHMLVKVLFREIFRAVLRREFRAPSLSRFASFVTHALTRMGLK